MLQGPPAFAASPGQLGRSALRLSGDHNDGDLDGQDDYYHHDDNDDDDDDYKLNLAKSSSTLFGVTEA